MRNAVGLALWFAFGALSWGQTTSAALSGVVMDPAGASVPGAKVTLFSSDTGLMRPYVTTDNGQFIFPLLPPGRYQLRIERAGFKLYVRPDVLLTLGQAARINPVLEISSEPQYVEVRDRMVDSASRLGYSLRDSSLQDLPMLGRNLMNLAANAPGVTGLGSLSEFDNFAPEKDFDMSANGRSSSGNIFLLDGLNVTSNIVLGVANLSPNPESIEEFTVQTNTFSVEQGRASSLQVSMVSKGGTNDWHGTGSYFFTDQHLRTRTVFTDRYEPFKKHNVAGSLGGPIQKNRTFVFGSFEALRSSETQANSIRTFESPEFVAWAQANYPNSLGTRLLVEAPMENVTILGVSKRAGDVAGSGCGTPASRMLPCDMPLIVEGISRPNASRDGLQYSLRGDRYFRDGRDRLFGNYYRTGLDLGNPPVRTGTSTRSVYGSKAVVLSWAHTFSTSLLSDVSFSGIEVHGDNAPEARYHIPQVDVGGQSTNFSPGWGGGFAQHNYNWRAIVSWVRGSHTWKFGGNYHWSDDLADFTRTTARPTFFFENLLDLVNEKPQSESSLGYDPLTGEPRPSVFGGKIAVAGVFVQNEWRATPNLTITMGLRWDDFGNPVGTQGMRFTTARLGAGSTLDERIAGTALVASEHPYLHRLNRNFSPRAGFAWSPGGSSWRIHGGVGLYQDWTALGQSVDLLRWNPPNFVFPTFRSDGNIQPIFDIGTSDVYPYGFRLPVIPLEAFDERGGLKGARPDIGFLTPELKSPQTLNFLGGVERMLPAGVRTGLTYSGSYTYDALVGTDMNRQAGDLLDGRLDRLNPSFGSMHQVWNSNVIRYDALIATAQRDLRWGTAFQASYTFSKTTDYVQAGTRQSRDDFYSIPNQHLLEQYKADANWDVRHRLSVIGVWRVPWTSPSRGLLRRLAGGWSVSTVVTTQTGTPFTVVNRNPFIPLWDASGNIIGMSAASGDYNADGYAYDFPNTPAIDFTGSHSRQDYIRGLFTKDDFPVPDAGTEGNLKRNTYRNPGILKIDTALLKSSAFRLHGETVNVQLRLEAFNVLNRTNLQPVNNNLAGATFGRSTAAYSPRVIQAGLRLLF